MALAIVGYPARGVTAKYAPCLPVNVSLCVDTKISAREFFRLYPEVKKKYFWGGKLWTKSFFVETIGNASEDVIRKYVQDQLKVMDVGEENSQQLGLF